MASLAAKSDAATSFMSERNGTVVVLAAVVSQAVSFDNQRV